MKKFLKWTGIVLGVLIGLVLLAVLALYPIGMEKLNRTYPNIPVETVKVPTGSDAVAHGGHVAIVWGCTKCHGEDLSGKLLADDPFLGSIPASNLTSGSEGVGRTYTDVDWIRAIRHGVMPDSNVEIFMYDYYSTMSDQDLGDLIAYLKQLPPVDSDYPETRFGPILADAPAIGLFTPAAEVIDHNAPRPADPIPGATTEYGKYLSTLCLECHSTKLGSNLKGWKQEDFVRAVKTGVLPNGRHLSPAMPLKTYGEMNDMELSALWQYFMDAKP